MAGMIALVGGDEFKVGCKEMDRAVLKATGRAHPRVLIVPTAAADQSPSKAASNGVAYFSGLGAEANALMVLGSDDANDERLLSPVDSADVIYFTGGAPGHLLDTLTGSLLLEKLRGARKRGAALAGSSAGAMVLGSWMRSGGWTDALGIVDGVAVLPHHEGSEPAQVAQELERSAPSGALVLGIDGMTSCLGGAEGWEVWGPGAVTLYNQGRWRRYRSGESVPVDSFDQRAAKITNDP